MLESLGLEEPNASGEVLVLRLADLPKVRIHINRVFAHGWAMQWYVFKQATYIKFQPFEAAFCRIANPKVRACQSIVGIIVWML